MDRLVNDLEKLICNKCELINESYCNFECNIKEDIASILKKHLELKITIK